MNRILLLILLSLTIVTTRSQRFNATFPEIKCGDVSPYKCNITKYRTIHAYCNNLLKPTWGMPFTRYSRFLPAVYADGYHKPREAKSGNPLPLARVLSRLLSPDKGILDEKFDLAAMLYLQIIAHDLVLTHDAKETPENQCCSEDGKLERDPEKYPLCYPALVPKDDPDFGPRGIQCLNSFIRRPTDVDHGCTARDGTVNQLVVATQFLDLSFLYGTNDDVSAKLREWKKGRLLFETRNNQHWPPKDNTCVENSTACYRTGDSRANLNFNLALYHVLFVRQHNRLANSLGRINPHWDDEKLFQEARRIFIAQHQYIAYYELLPIFLGLKNSVSHKLMYNTTDYVNDYNPRVNPSTFNEMSAGVFRIFHSLTAGDTNVVNENRDPAQSKVNVNQENNNPGVLEVGDNFDSIFRGISSQPQEACDQYFNKEFTKNLNQGPKKVKSDVRALDIHRGRDQGFAPYNDYRQACGLLRARKWKDFLDLISPENVKIMRKLYESPDDVDLSVGAILEKLSPGALLGPTALCIATRQFYKSRVGDRYFFENGKSASAFTLDQLNEIRKTNVARFFCDNTKIRSIQRNPFKQISPKNPLVPCDSIPSINLHLWKEK